ncbi:MAG: PAS domain S-box protein [Armatimonadota bacterium]|nr:PAS domain S-box protein [Armatimonadota bacterium]MDR5696502.1 PAS domain S-box protein [Armatimonadota bacterium]
MAIFRRSPQQALRRVEEPLAVVSELISDAVFLFDAQGAVTWASQRAGEAFGMRPAALARLSVRDLIPPSPAAERAFRQPPSDGAWEGRLTFRRPDGQTFDAAARVGWIGDVGVCTVAVPGAEVHTSAALAARTQQLIRDLPIAIEVYDPKGNVLAANDAWCALFGMPASRGHRGNALHRGSVYGPAQRSALEAAFRGQAADIPAFEWLPASGPRTVPPRPTRLVDIRLAPVRNRAGELRCVVAFAFDVTEQRRMEGALRESESRYRALIEESPDAMFLLEDGVFRLVNRRFVELFGVGSADVIGRIGPLAMCEVEDRAALSAYLSDRLAMLSPRTTAIFRARASDGTVRTCEIHANRVLLRGKPMLLGTVRDLTEQRRAAQTLQLQADLLDQVHEAIVAMDWDGCIVYCNRGAETLYGWRRDEVAGRPFDRLVQPEPHEATIARLRPVLLRDGSWRGEIQHRGDGGRTLWLSATLSVRTDAERRPVGIVGVYRDISEQKRLEDQLLQAQKMESIGTLAGGIAHDFNNILGTMVGYLGLLKEDLPPDTQLHAYFEVVERSAMRASELTRQLLGFARKGKFEVQPVDLAALCKDVVQLFRTTLDGKIELRTHFPEGLPAVEGDSGQLHHVVLNLCMNARDAMPDGGILEIALAPALAPDPASGDVTSLRRYVALSVGDTGVGMDERTRARMFEPFFTTKEPGKGTGLGLAMVYGIVHNHGGFLDVRTAVGRGTTVEVYLPVAQGTAEEQGEGETEVAEGAGEMILVVDDEEPLCNLLRDVLVRRGYRVMTATGGEEAVRIYQQYRDEIDLVLLDMTMPGMSGKETFHAIRAIDPDARVLLSSGYTQEGAAQDVLRRGACGFLQKPYLITELASKVREILQEPTAGTGRIADG